MKSSHVRILRSDETAVFCEQLALLMNGGVSVYEGIYIMYEQAGNGREKELLGLLNEKMGSNIPLYQALEECGAFPEYMVHAVSVGEKAGHLEEVFGTLSDYYERDSRLKSRIRSAIAYPLVIFAIVACIMAVLVIRILPMFERMFEELADGVSVSTAESFRAGLAAGRVAAVIVGVLLLLIILVFASALTEWGRKLLHRFFTASIFTAKLSQLIAGSRFISSVAMMLSSGMDISEGLDREKDACTDPVVRERISRCIDLYNDQNSLDVSIAGSGLVSGLDAQLLTVAVKTGDSDEALARIGERYDTQIGDRVNKLTTAAETVLVVLLTVLVGAVLAAVMIPLANLISTVG